MNSQNISHMRQLVINGTKTYPGCNWVEEILSENGITRNRRINLSRMDLLKRQALASRLVGNGTFVVGRQVSLLCDKLKLNYVHVMTWLRCHMLEEWRKLHSMYFAILRV